MKVHLMVDSIYTNNFIKCLKEQDRLKDNKFIIVYFGDLKYIEEDIKKISKIIRRVKGGFKNSKEYRIICNEINREDEVFIHYLSTEFVWIVNGTRAKEYNWSLWGGDFYPYCNIDLYDDESKKIIKDLNLSISKSLKDRLKEFISLLLRKKAIKKIDYFITWNKYDYELVKNAFNKKAKFKYFVYPKQNDYEFLDELNKVEKKDKSIVIQVGNSGDPTNNHISILKELSKCGKEGNFKVIVPLSYGDKRYIKKVIEIGEESLGDKFIPITEYMALEDYYKVLNKVDIAIMNHLRQQGAGNINTLLYLGKKVYMNGSITTYKTFKEWGLHIYEVSEIFDKGEEEIFQVNRELLAYNKAIIREKFNNDAIF